MDKDTPPYCCYIPCTRDAYWQIYPDPLRTDEDYTHACEAHVGALLEDGRNSVSPIGYEP